MAIGVSTLGAHGSEGAIHSLSTTASSHPYAAILSTSHSTPGAVAAFSSDRVVATASDTLLSHTSSRALDGLRHADSFTGSAGVSAPTVTGGATLDKIFVAAHLAATTPTIAGGLGVDPHAGGAGHTLFSIDEGTSVSIRGATPTIHGGHH